MSTMNNYMSTIQGASQQTQQSAMIGMQSALAQGAYALNGTAIEAQGVEAQLQMQQIVTIANLQADLDGMASKNALLLAGKAMETYTLMAQHREKILGLFTQITMQRSATSWNNMKQMVQGFKF